MSDNLIAKLFNYNRSYYNPTLDKLCLEKFKKEIKENLVKYNNLTINEIYPDNDWIQMPTNAGMNKMIDLRDYSTFQLNTLSYNKDYLYMLSYKCLKTNSTGYTFQYNFQQILHPFHMVKHNFKLTDIDSTGVNYKCSNCGVSGFKKKGAKSGDIVVRDSNMIYSCDEMIIKSIIE